MKYKPKSEDSSQWLLYYPRISYTQQNSVRPTRRQEDDLFYTK